MAPSIALLRQRHSPIILRRRPVRPTMSISRWCAPSAAQVATLPNRSRRQLARSRRQRTHCGSRAGPVATSRYGRRRPDTLVDLTATWRSGYAAACKAVYTGSIPVVASLKNACKHGLPGGLTLRTGECAAVKAPHRRPLSRRRAFTAILASPIRSQTSDRACEASSRAVKRHDVASAWVGRQRGELRRPVGVRRVVQIAFGGGDVAVAHHPLDLVNLEHADRLRAEGVAQVVVVPMSAQARICRCLCYADVG